MKQRIAHGATIDAATPEEVAAIFSRVRDQRDDVDYHREKGIINLDAAGKGVRAVHVSRQYNWRMERVAIGGPGAVNALVTINESDSGSDADMLEVIQLGTAGRYSDSFSNSLWVPAGQRIWLVVTGGAASGQVMFNFQVRLHKATPA